MSESSRQNPIEILLVSDANFAAYLATTIVSILKNAAEDDVLRFHIVDGGLASKDRDRIESLKNVRDFESIYYQPRVDDYLKYFRRDIQAFPVVVNYRLLMAEFLPKTLDKIIYSDVDVVALGSLRELWETPVDDAFLAAVPDQGIDLEHKRDLGLPDDYKYFYSGNLLVNLKKWREDAVLKELLDICVEIRDRIEYPDQDALNVYGYRHGYRELSERWCCHPKDYKENDSVILHYMGIRHQLPRLDILFRYAAMTPYKKVPIQRARHKLGLWLNRKRCQLVCLFLFKKEWRLNYRKKNRRLR